MKTPDSINRLLNQRRENDRFRNLVVPDPNKVDFWSNDYLGLARNKDLQKSFLSFLTELNDKTLFGSTGSRLVSGNQQVFVEAETALASHFLSDSALLFPSGYMANLAFFSSVPQRNDLVLYDSEIHASIKASLRQCNADVKSFRHNDLDDLKQKLKARKSEVYVATESVFSISGDIAPLKDLASFCKESNCKLVVDEAHSTGMFGNNGSGLCAELNITNEIFARIHTFGKALGTAGAIIACTEDIKTYLVNYALPFIYSTAMPPVQVHNIMFNLNYLKDDPTALIGLKSNIELFQNYAQEFGLHNSFSNFNYILNMNMSSDSMALLAAKELNNNGFMIKAMLPPTVPEGHSSLRIIMHSFNSEAEIENFFRHVKKLF